MNHAEDQPHDETRPEVPDFDLIRRIGEGGFGQVWLAANRTTGRLRAVKLIPLGGQGSKNAAGREIVSLKHLEARVGEQHPNLLAIYHVGKTAEHLFYVMDPAEDVSGAAASPEPGYVPATLERRLEGGALAPDDCLAWARQLLLGLGALHAAGMVHRDVKPANCLFVGGQLKLADFGLLTEADPLVSRLGTRQYMPPDGRMDTRADVYAAGLVIYQMLVGLPAESFPQLGNRADEIARDAVLRRLNRLVLRACQPEAGKRFADARAMLAELDAAPSKPEPHRKWLGLWATAAGLLAAVVLIVVGIWANRPGRVEVNFITEPYYNAAVYLDDQPLLDPDGVPLTTPCTAADLPGRKHRVVFKHGERGELDAGTVDFAKVREVVARWPESVTPLPAP